MSSSKYIQLAMEFLSKKRTPKIGKNHEKNRANKLSKKGTILGKKSNNPNSQTIREYNNRKIDRANKVKKMTDRLTTETK